MGEAEKRIKYLEETMRVREGERDDLRLEVAILEALVEKLRDEKKDQNRAVDELELEQAQTEQRIADLEETVSVHESKQDNLQLEVTILEALVRKLRNEKKKQKHEAEALEQAEAKEWVMVEMAEIDDEERRWILSSPNRASGIVEIDNGYHLLSKIIKWGEEEEQEFVRISMDDPSKWTMRLVE